MLTDPITINEIQEGFFILRSKLKSRLSKIPFIIFKSLSYCFKKTIGFDVCKPCLQVVQGRV